MKLSCTSEMTNSLPATPSLGILNFDPCVECWLLPSKCLELRSCRIMVYATNGAIAVLPQLLSFGIDLGILQRSHLLMLRRFNMLIALSHFDNPPSSDLDESEHAGAFSTSVSSFRKLYAFLRRSKQSLHAGSFDNLPSSIKEQLFSSTLSLLGFSILSR